MNPYLSAGTAKMLPSIVCYCDILGFRKLTSEYLESGRGEELLARLHAALTAAHERIRESSHLFDDNAFFHVNIFTDNIVVGYPVLTSAFERGEMELGSIIGLFSEYQATLASEGFLVRGGIAYGNHYMDKDIVFGDALIEAVSCDVSGGAPRIILAESARKMIFEHLKFYSEPKWAPQADMVLMDPDGKLFINYLDQAFAIFPDDPIFFELIKGHKTTIEIGLENFRGSPGTRSKFEWAANYHNYVLQRYLERYPLYGSDDGDLEQAAAVEEVQKLNDYIIANEMLLVGPSEISEEC